MSIGKKLQELRGKRTRREIALALGVSESAYTKYERDERRPRDCLKQRIAQYYGTTVEAIFFTQVVHKRGQTNQKRPQRATNTSRSGSARFS